MPDGIGNENRGSEGDSKNSLKTQIKENDINEGNEEKSVNKETEIKNSEQHSCCDNGDRLENLCENCNKVFKTLNSYTKHKKEQRCVDFMVRTYCDLCDKEFKERKDYDVHMMSGEHMAQINKSSFNNIIDLDSKKEKKVLDNINRQAIVDPYLNATESLSLVDSDNKFTIVYKDGRKEDKVMRADKKKVTKDSTVGIDETQNMTHEPVSREDSLSPISNVSSTEDNNEKSRYEKELVSKEEDEEARKEREEAAAVRRKKIMILLGKIQDEDKSVVKFLKILNKLNLEDYKGLNNEIIKDKNIKVLPKQKYLKAVKDFIGLLIKRKNEGYNAHNGNDIQQIVTNLTC